MYRLLTEPLTVEHRNSFDKLLINAPGKSVRLLTWLRQPPGEPSARSLLAHIDRLTALRALGLPAAIGHNVHQNWLLRLAREGTQTTAYQIEEYESERRYATLVAIVLDTIATLTDDILEMIGSSARFLLGRVMIDTSNPEIIKRLNRAEGQLKSIVIMLEEERGCLDIAQQLQAVEKAIANAKKALVHDTHRHCLEHAVREESRNADDTIPKFKEITKYL